ncbi:LD-carboxypeptidase [bacterium]|nr:LD-carboxypeptidase [bacterium]
MRKIFFIAPSWHSDRKELLRARELLPADFNCEIDEDIFKQERMLAGSDERRIREFNKALNSDSDIIWAVRGGYGACRIISDLIFSGAAKKTWIGFSDFSMIGYSAYQAGHNYIYGPMPHTFEYQKTGLKQTITILKSNNDATRVIKHHGSIANKISGRVAVFCLKLLVSSMGTPLQPVFDKDTVLFLEDVDERSYALERDLIQLHKCGIFNNIKAIVVNFTNTLKPDEAEPVEWLGRNISLPVLEGIPFGHSTDAIPLIYGQEVDLEKDRIVLSDHCL